MSADYDPSKLPVVRNKPLGPSEDILGGVHYTLAVLEELHKVWVLESDGCVYLYRRCEFVWGLRWRSIDASGRTRAQGTLAIDRSPSTKLTERYKFLNRH